MMRIPFTAGALALALAASPAAAQHEHHAPPAPPAPPPAEPAHQHPSPAPAAPEPPAAEPDHQGHAPAAGASPHDPHAMTGALGRYPLSREASGTAWQPDSSPHGGLHLIAGDWT